MIRALLAAAFALLIASIAHAGLIMRGSGGVTPPPAGIAHGNDSYGQDGTSETTYTLAHNLSAGSGNSRLLVVGVSLDLQISGGLVAEVSCSYAGSAMTKGIHKYEGGMQVNIFYLLDEDLPANAGSANIVATSSHAGYLKIIASDFTGAAQEYPLDSRSSIAYGRSVSTTIYDWDSEGALVWGMAAHSASGPASITFDEDDNEITQLVGGNAHVATAAYWFAPGGEVWEKTFTAQTTVDGFFVMDLVVFGAAQ